AFGGPGAFQQPMQGMGLDGRPMPMRPAPNPRDPTGVIRGLESSVQAMWDQAMRGAAALGLDDELRGLQSSGNAMGMAPPPQGPPMRFPQQPPGPGVRAPGTDDPPIAPPMQTP